MISKKYNLSPQQSTIVLAVMCRPRVSHDQLSEIVWPDADEMPDAWQEHLNVLITGARRKLKPHGWYIHFLKGRGFALCQN